MSRFSIFPLPALNGELAIAPLPGKEGRLDKDFIVLRAFDPALVVSMTTLDEMARLGAAGLPDLLRVAQIVWRHFPVHDFGAPDTASIWPDLSRAIHDKLNAGERVLIHCRGGCGRSGMIALRVMIEAGENPDAALARLRKVRPCAVETREQLEWAFNR